MTRFGSQYQVARSTGVCAATGEALEPGATMVATLCESPTDDGLARLDFSEAAWEAGHRPDELFSYWRTVVPAPNAKRRLLVDDDVLVDLFHRLAEDDRPQRIAFRFVLALILMRKRKLKFVGRVEAVDGEPEHWLLEPRPRVEGRSADQVINPHLSDDDVRELTNQLSEILQSEL